MLAQLARKWKQLALFAVALAVCAVLAELVFRSFVRGSRAAAADGFTHGLLEFAPGKPFLYWLKKNLRITNHVRQADGVTVPWEVRTNRYRCRGEDLDLAALDAPTKRLLFLGDSYTFGYAATEEDTFPRRIEALLRAKGQRVVAINAGVPGFNSVQEHQYLEEVFDLFRPDAVILGYVVNDADPPMFVSIEPEARYRYCGSWLWEESKFLVNALGRLTVADDELFPGREIVATGDVLGQFDYESPAWRESRTALGAMAELCSGRGVSFLVAVFPSFIYPFDDTYPYVLIHDKVLAWGAELGFKAVDLLPGFLGRDVKQLLVRGDGHPNAEGHRLIAEALVEHVSL